MQSKQPDRPKGRILLVTDPNLSSRETLKTAIRQAGYQLDCAPSSATALESFDQAGASAVLIDMDLPDASALGLCRDLRLKQAATSTALVMLHPDECALDFAAASAAGATEFIQQSSPQALIEHRLEGAIRSVQALPSKSQ